MSRTSARLCWVPLLAALGGCSGYDPTNPDRPGTWQPLGANNANLHAMIADPSHLERGVGSSTDRGAAGADATTRLLEGRRRPLPASRTTATAFGGPAGPGGGAAAQGR